jgi:hypothetical protein
MLSQGAVENWQRSGYAGGGNEAGVSPAQNTEHLVLGAHEVFHSHVRKDSAMIPRGLVSGEWERNYLEEAMVAIWTLKVAQKLGANTEYWRKYAVEMAQKLTASQQKWLKKYSKSVNAKIKDSERSSSAGPGRPTIGFDPSFERAVTIGNPPPI